MQVEATPSSNLIECFNERDTNLRKKESTFEGV